ncbi:unnamed protein product, partial [Schistosoma bovis]
EIATNNIKQFSQRYHQPFRRIAKQALAPTILKFCLFCLIGEMAANNMKQFSQRYHQPFREKLQNRHLHQQF